MIDCTVTQIEGEEIKTWDPKSEERMQLLLVDISRAYFNAKTDPSRPTYVKLPSKAEAPAGTCALLRRHMYGTQRAAEDWQDEYSSTLVSMGFQQGSASACVLRHPAKHITLGVHADDQELSRLVRSSDDAALRVDGWWETWPGG